MRPLSTFSLHVEPATESRPACVSIAVSSSPRNHLGVLRLTPDCMTLDELEGYINAMQDELDNVYGRDRRRVILVLKSIDEEEHVRERGQAWVGSGLHLSRGPGRLQERAAGAALVDGRCDLASTGGKRAERVPPNLARS